MPSPVKSLGLKSLVVNADDFGLNPAVNRGVLAAFRNGIVTSASVAASGEAFEEAMDMAKSAPGLDLGVHLTAVEERPLRAGPSLAPGGRFPASAAGFAWRWVRGIIPAAELEAEFRAQIERVLSRGFSVSHLDSHCHVHLLPGCFRLTLKLAAEYRVPFVRVPRGAAAWDGASAWSSPRRFVRQMQLPVLELLSRLSRPAGAAAPRSAGRMLGVSAAGKLTREKLLALIRRAPAGLTELLCHPADARNPHHDRWGYDGVSELAALTAPEVRQAAAGAGVRLTGFRDA